MARCPYGTTWPRKKLWGLLMILVSWKVTRSDYQRTTRNSLAFIKRLFPMVATVECRKQARMSPAEVGCWRRQGALHFLEPIAEPRAADSRQIHCSLCALVEPTMHCRLGL